MKRILLIAALALVLCGCGRRHIIGVSFPEAPVEIADNAGFGMGLINMFNIIRTPEGIYRMYFCANPQDGIAEHEDYQNLYLAESSDGFHYELKCKLMDALVEQTVFMVKDREYPYRMVGSQWYGEKSTERAVYLWKSKDGMEFTDRKEIFHDMHDTQNVMIPRGRRLKMYTRITQERYRNRRMAVAEFNMHGKQVSDTEILAGEFLYNSAACKVDRRYDLLFPTYYNTYGGTSDACFFRCYLADGPFVRQIPCELNRWVEADEHWVLACPGFVKIGKDLYLAYNARTRSHEASNNSMVSRFKLVKAVIEYE